MAKARASKLHFCGPKLSVCCSLLSVWGILMLSLLGIFFYIRSGSLLEDIPLVELPSNATVAEETKHLTEAFHTSAVNCWGAAGVYVAVLVISIIQCYFNFKN